MRVTCLDPAGEGTYSIILNKKEITFIRDIMKWNISIPKMMESYTASKDIVPAKLMHILRLKIVAVLDKKD